MMGRLPLSSSHSVSAASAEMEEYEHGPAPSSCPQMKPLWQHGVVYQYLAELLSFICRVSCGAYKPNTQEQDSEDLAVQV